MARGQDAAALPVARCAVSEAHAALSRACAVLREAGFAETAADLDRARALVGTWTAPGGYLEHIEKGAGHGD